MHKGKLNENEKSIALAISWNETIFKYLILFKLTFLLFQATNMFVFMVIVFVNQDQYSFLKKLDDDLN